MKIIYLLFLALFICTKVFATEGTGFTLISERTEAPPGAKFTFVHYKGLKPFGYTNASAKAFNGNGKVNQAFFMQGSHSINIYNNTKVTQSYSYKFSLVPPDSLQYNRLGNISVEPGFSYSDGGMSTVTLVQPRQGKMGFLVMTEIYGETSKRSTDYGVITIT